MKMRTLFMLGLCSALWLSCDNDDDSNKKALGDTDDMFIEKAAMSNMTEVDFANLAISKATNAAVVDFAEHMVTSHSEAQTELRGIADRYDKIAWPETLDAEHAQIKSQLMTLTGAKFDSMYMAIQVMDHEKTIGIFNSEISGGTEQAVKDYANKYLPHIQEHFATAVSIKADLDNSAGD
jgi:putative membrane protein